MAFDVNELVSMMSAPASRYAEWMARMMPGWVRVRRSLWPAELARPVGEPLAPVVPLAQAVGLDHGPHRAIEHEDALGEERLEQGEPRLPAQAGGG